MTHAPFLLSLSSPTSLTALEAMGIGFAIFLLSLGAARKRSDKAERVPEKRSMVSMIGVFIQMLGFAIVGFGPIKASIAPLSTLALGEAAGVLALMVVAIVLFVSASRAMGRNWSIVARTREDHELVTSGPFASTRRVRDRGR